MNKGKLTFADKQKEAMMIDTYPIEDLAVNMFSLEEASINMFSVSLIVANTPKRKVELTDYDKTTTQMTGCKVGARRLVEEVR